MAYDLMKSQFGTSLLEGAFIKGHMLLWAAEAGKYLRTAVHSQGRCLHLMCVFGT